MDNIDYIGLLGRLPKKLRDEINKEIGVMLKGGEEEDVDTVSSGIELSEEVSLEGSAVSREGEREKAEIEKKPENPVKKKTVAKKKKASKGETAEEKKLLDHFFVRWKELLEETPSVESWKPSWESPARREILKFHRKEKIPLWRMYAICKWARNDSFWIRNFQTPAKLTKKNRDGIPYYYVLAEHLGVDDWYSVDPNRDPSSYMNMKQTGRYIFRDE